MLEYDDNDKLIAFDSKNRTERDWALYALFCLDKLGAPAAYLRSYLNQVIEAEWTANRWAGPIGERRRNKLRDAGYFLMEFDDEPVVGKRWQQFRRANSKLGHDQLLDKIAKACAKPPKWQFIGM